MNNLLHVLKNFFTIWKKRSKRVFFLTFKILFWNLIDQINNSFQKIQYRSQWHCLTWQLKLKSPFFKQTGCKTFKTLLHDKANDFTALLKISKKKNKCIPSRKKLHRLRFANKQTLFQQFKLYSSKSQQIKTKEQQQMCDKFKPHTLFQY